MHIYYLGVDAWALGLIVVIEYLKSHFFDCNNLNYKERIRTSDLRPAGRGSTAMVVTRLLPSGRERRLIEAWSQNVQDYVGTFRVGPRGFSTQRSLKCLFVCLFVCLFIFPHNQKLCTIENKSLHISKQYPLHKQKLLVPPPLPGAWYTSKTQRLVYLPVCLSVYFSAQVH